MRRFSLLELIHPDGSANTSFVLGSNCPEHLYPELQIESDPKVALFIIAPSVEECRSEGWLEEAAKSVGQRLSEDGVCYVLLPLPWRRRMIRLLSQANLVIDLSFWHFPDWASSQYLVPLQHGPAQFAVERILTAPLWKRILAKEMFRYSSARRILGASWKSFGFSVRRPGARPLFQWLFKPEREESFSGTAIIRRSWRGNRGANILYCFPYGELLPATITKTSIVDDSLSRPDREAEVLETMGPRACTQGVRVPHVLQKKRNGQRSSLFLSPVPGRPASDLLALDPSRLSTLLTKIVGWLEYWHSATVNVRPLVEARIGQDFFAPIERLAPLLQNADGYRNWLADHIRGVAGTPFPFVAGHNDLTMANVLVDQHGHLGVVDWETGMAESWPLVDFYYAVTDAVRIAQGYTDWLEAFKACYQPKGPFAPEVDCREKRLQSSIEMSPGSAVLCFHACWLHHASNEHRVSRPGDPQPFLQIVQWLALNYSKIPLNTN